MGQHSIDIVYLISQSFLQNMDIKHIPEAQLCKIGKHLLTCHAAVSGKDGMGAATAYRK